MSRLELNCVRYGQRYAGVVALIDDERFMKVALDEAREGVGQTSPNPAVGALLVQRGGGIVSRGHHRGVGHPHAEIECFASSKPKPGATATLFVTLEPCSTQGRTPACTEAIIAQGIRNVVIGTIDPNPRHAGRGIEVLRAAGIKVRTGVLEAECASLNEAFNKWIVTRQPFVIAKCGMSLDGRLTRPPGEMRWLTGAKARLHAHGLRAKMDAILVGAETIRRDNPQLTVRGAERGRQPLRVVLTRTGRLPRDASIFTDRYRDRTLVLSGASLREVLVQLGKRDITSVLIEGGGEVLSAALDQRLVDKVALYVAPILTGGPTIAFGGRGAGTTAEGARLERLQYEQLGPDLYISGYVKYPESARTQRRATE